MSDIATIWSGTRGDWLQTGPTLASGSDLETAVLISLFTDRAALPDDTIPDGTGDPRGWWADDPTVPIGSRLWLIYRAKRTPEVLLDAQDYCTEALQWLIDDGVAADVEVYCEWQVTNRLGIQVTVIKTDGTTQVLAFAWVWNGN